MCEQKYYLSYILGIREPPNKKATLGSVVHKALELLSYQKLCWQRGTSSYMDDTFGEVCIDDIDPMWATERAYEYYAQLEPEHGWTKGDLALCKSWTNKTLTISGGRCDPRNHNIIMPEQVFDFTIDEPWAKYHFELPDGEVIEGQLGLRGTMDLVYEDEPGIIDVLDYKTGQQLNWATGKPKDFKSLCNDPQLRLYHLASTRLFPDADEIYMRIVYMNYDGCFILPYSRDDLPDTMRMIKRKFDEIRYATRPRLKKSWKCNRICHFGKASHPEDPSKTMCEFFKDKIRADGINKVTLDYNVNRAWERYGSGGGRQEQTSE
jgi:hypothetical protein